MNTSPVKPSPLLFLLGLTLNLKLIRTLGLLTTLYILIDSIQNARSGTCTAKGLHDTAHVEVADGRLGPTDRLARLRGRLGGGLLLGLELEKGFFFVGFGVLEEDDATSWLLGTCVSE